MKEKIIEAIREALPMNQVYMVATSRSVAESVYAAITPLIEPRAISVGELHAKFLTWSTDYMLAPETAKAIARNLAAIAAPYLAKAEPHEEILKLAQALYDCQPFVNEYMSERCYPLYSPYRESLSKAAEPKEQKPLDDEMLVKNIHSKILESECSILSFEDQAREIINLVGAAKDAEIEGLRVELAQTKAAMAGAQAGTETLKDLLRTTQAEVERLRHSVNEYQTTCGKLAEEKRTAEAELAAAGAEIARLTTDWLNARNQAIALGAEQEGDEWWMLAPHIHYIEDGRADVTIFDEKEAAVKAQNSKGWAVIGQLIPVHLPHPETESEVLCRELRKVRDRHTPGEENFAIIDRALKYIEAKG